MKTELYAMKTNKGYGFFQKYEAKLPRYIADFFIIYRKQIPKIKNINSIFKEDYYFENVAMRDYNKHVGTTYIIGKNEVTYLGKRTMPKNIVLPKYARILSKNHAYSLKYSWLLLDLSGENHYAMFNGQPNGYKLPSGILAYNKLTPEIIEYPIYGFKPISSLRDAFDKNFHPRDYNDEYVIAQTLKARAEMTQEDKKAFKDEWKDKRDDFYK